MANGKRVEFNVDANIEKALRDLAALERTIDRVRRKGNQLPMQPISPIPPLTSNPEVEGGGGGVPNVTQSATSIGNQRAESLQRRFAEIDNANRSASAQAALPNQPGSVPTIIPTTGKPKRSALSGARSAAVSGASQTRLGRLFGDGARIESEGVKFGSLTFGNTGRLALSVGETIGPAVGYAFAAVGVLKATNAAADTARQSLRNSVMSGQGVNEAAIKGVRAAALKTLDDVAGVASSVSRSVVEFGINGASLAAAARGSIRSGLVSVSEALGFISQEQADARQRQVALDTYYDEQSIQLTWYGDESDIGRLTKAQDQWKQAQNEAVLAARREARKNARDLATALRDFGIDHTVSSIEESIKGQWERESAKKAMNDFVEFNGLMPSDVFQLQGEDGN